MNKPFEIIFSENGSTDNTVKLIETFIENKDNFKKSYDFTNDIAKPYFKMRIKKYRNDLKKENVGEREKQKYFNYMETYFKELFP